MKHEDLETKLTPNEPYQIGNMGWILWDGNALYKATSRFKELGTFLSLDAALDALKAEENDVFHWYTRWTY